MLILFVYPTSNCGADTGYTEGYLVDAASGEALQDGVLKQLQHYMRRHPEF